MNDLTLNNSQTPLDHLRLLANDNQQLTKQEYQTFRKFATYPTVENTFIFCSAMLVGQLGLAIFVGYKHSASNGRKVALSAAVTCIFFGYYEHQYKSLEREWELVKVRVQNRYSHMKGVFISALQELIPQWNNGTKYELTKKCGKQYLLNEFVKLIQSDDNCTELNELAKKIKNISFGLQSDKIDELKAMCQIFTEIFSKGTIDWVEKKQDKPFNKNKARTYSFKSAKTSKKMKVYLGKEYNSQVPLQMVVKNT